MVGRAGHVQNQLAHQIGLLLSKKPYMGGPLKFRKYKLLLLHLLGLLGCWGPMTHVAWLEYCTAVSKYGKITRRNPAGYPWYPKDPGKECCMLKQ